jgi:REP element-mobilizing transposase RayT
MQRLRIAESGYPYFVTCTIVKWLPIFVEPRICDIIIDSLRHCREARGLKIHCYVIMPTHLHLILSTLGDLSGILRDFKRHTSKEIVKAFANVSDPPFRNVFSFCGRDNRPPTDHKVWQDGNHPEQIREFPFFQQKVDYIHGNPFQKGLVTDPLAWRYSSMRAFEGAGNVPLDIDWLEW